MPELLASLEEQQERLTAALGVLAPLPDAAAGSTVSALERLELLVWHETDHTGQALLYRRAAGLASPIG